MSERPQLPHGHIAPSILAANFSRLGEDVSMTMDAGARVIHFDVMDGHFVPPITIGALVLESISDLVHDRGGLLDVHLMIESPENQIEAFAKAGADVITVHPEATPHIHYTLQQIREHGCNAGVVVNPGTPVE
ncbi:MAG TPA: ribulose-phosphate 3-epimerase, partial [Gaiellaceae bacterium]|nr:ribulose-phosphate 3-epimerase [Gaiellaceae bacterium]